MAQTTYTASEVQGLQRSHTAGRMAFVVAWTLGYLAGIGHSLGPDLWAKICLNLAPEQTETASIKAVIDGYSFS